MVTDDEGAHTSDTLSSLHLSEIIRSAQEGRARAHVEGEERFAIAIGW